MAEAIALKIVGVKPWRSQISWPGQIAPIQTIKSHRTFLYTLLNFGKHASSVYLAVLGQ